MTLATKITLLRLALIPFLITVMLLHYWFAALLIFIAAMITDFLDGYLARTRHEETQLGALLDAGVDKLLAISCCTVLALIPSPLSCIPSWFFWLLVGKEIIILLGGIYSAFYCQEMIQPTQLGKYTGVMQLGVLALAWLLCSWLFASMPSSNILLGILIGFLMVSCYSYFRAFQSRIIACTKK